MAAVGVSVDHWNIALLHANAGADETAEAQRECRGVQRAQRRRLSNDLSFTHFLPRVYTQVHAQLRWYTGDTRICGNIPAPPQLLTLT